MRKLLITGISGGQGRLVARRLCSRWQVTGVDRSPWPSPPPGVTVHTLDLRKKRFENVLRTERPDAVVHFGFVRHFRSDPALRHEVNVEGTKRLLEHCVAWGVKQLLVLSSSYVYGALPNNPRYMDEDHPLNASRTFPEIRDLGEVEGLASTFLWRYPEIATVILRPVNVLGPYVKSAIRRYLRLGVQPTVTGFNPMMQFIHEEDLAKAVELALENRLRGIYNVAGAGAVPLKTAIAATRGRPLPVPGPLARLMVEPLFQLGLYEFPSSALDFLKFPCTVSDRRFRTSTGFEPEHTLGDTFASIA